MGRGGSFCCFTLSIAYRYTVVNPSQWLRLLRLLLLPLLPRGQLCGLVSPLIARCHPFRPCFSLRKLPLRLYLFKSSLLSLPVRLG